MKTKVFLSLSVVLFLILVSGFISSQIVLAQHYKMQPTPMPQPTNRILWDYDSGWVQILPGEINMITLTHNLGGDPGEYFVYLVGKALTGEVHQSNYGGSEFRDREYGARWYRCNSNDIKVWRVEHDDGANTNWSYCRVRILRNQ